MLLYNCPEIMSAYKYPYCSKPLREKDTLKFRHIFGRGKTEREVCRNGEKIGFFLDSHFLVFKYLTYLPNVFSTICKRILSTFSTSTHPPPPPPHYYGNFHPVSQEKFSVSNSRRVKYDCETVNFKEIRR